MSSTATRWAAWAARTGRHGAAATSSMSPGSTAGPITVEIYINQAWTDITSYVSYTDRISVTRGRADESATAEPSKLSLTLFNRDGRFCDTNPLSPLYGLIGRNTPIRVSKIVQGSRFFRFTGEVVAWPQTFDITGLDVRVKLEAAGIKRRLSQGNAPIKSAMFRGITQAPTLANLVAYWPLEDVAGSASFATPLVTGSPMLITGGVPTLSSFTGFSCSSPLPVLDTNSEFTGVVTGYTSGTGTQIRFLLATPAAGGANNQVLVRNVTTGTAATIDVYYTTGGNLNLTAFDINGTNILTAGPMAAAADGALLRVSLELTQNGPDIAYALRSIPVGSSIATSLTGTLSANTVGNLTRMIVSPAGGTPNITVGHLTLQNTITSITDLQGQLAAGSGEAAGVRVQRLCGEENISFHAIGDVTSSAAMGPQPIDTLINVLQQCPDTDLGMLYEPVDDLGIGYRTLASLYNQTASLALDIAQHELSEPLQPIPDDQKTLNDVTVSRDGGSSARAELLTGAMSVLSPPNGVGRYDTSYTLSLPDDSGLLNQAGWRVHVGTVNEARYPQVHLQLAHSSFTYALTAAALTTDVGDRITIDNPPPQLPPDEISLLVQGYTEVFDQFLHEIVFNCSPESPYRVGYLDDAVYGRLDTDGSTLHAAVGAGDTSWLVDTTNPNSPSWTLNPADWPFSVTIGGEVVSVTKVIPYPGVTDGTFEAGVSGWTPTASTFVQSSAQAHTGTYSGLLTVTGAPTQSYVRPTTPAAVVAGSSYILTQWVYAASGSPSTNVSIDWFDGGGVYITTSVGPGAVIAAGWVQQVLTATAPAGAATAYWGPTIYASPPAGTAIYVDDVTFQLVGGPQAFTVGRAVNGVVKSHVAGEDIRLTYPTILAL